MINHHPTFELLQSYVNGELPASLAAGVAMHAEMCPTCKQQITLLTEQIAEASLGLDDSIAADAIGFSDEQNVNFGDFDLDQMIADITSSDEIAEVKAPISTSVEFKGKQFSIPSMLSSIELGKPANIGKLSRARLHLDEGEIRSSLLHIEPGGSVPEHTHKGFELTLLLAGSFSDEKGEYVKGDFIMLDGNHQHHPVSEKGCLCYTVANDALHFTQGINKLLNPIGSLIY